MTLATISSGHADLADVLFLAAFVIFAVIFIIKLATPPADSSMVGRLDLAAAGLACLALAWFVL